MKKKLIIIGLIVFFNTMYGMENNAITTRGKRKAKVLEKPIVMPNIYKLAEILTAGEDSGPHLNPIKVENRGQIVIKDAKGYCENCYLFAGNKKVCNKKFQDHTCNEIQSRKACESCNALISAPNKFYLLEKFVKHCINCSDYLTCVEQIFVQANISWHFNNLHNYTLSRYTNDIYDRNNVSYIHTCRKCNNVSEAYEDLQLAEGYKRLHEEKYRELSRHQFLLKLEEAANAPGSLDQSQKALFDFNKAIDDTNNSVKYIYHCNRDVFGQACSFMIKGTREEIELAKQEHEECHRGIDQCRSDVTESNEIVEVGSASIVRGIKTGDAMCIKNIIHLD